MQVHLCFGSISHQGKDDNTQALWGTGKGESQTAASDLHQVSLLLPCYSRSPGFWEWLLRGSMLGRVLGRLRWLGQQRWEDWGFAQTGGLQTTKGSNSTEVCTQLWLGMLSPPGEPRVLLKHSPMSWAALSLVPGVGNLRAKEIREAHQRGLYLLGHKLVTRDSDFKFNICLKFNI